MLDLVLAMAHHVLVFGLATMMAMELAGVRAERVPIRRLAALDAGAGVSAGLIVLVGIARVIWGAKGWAAYADNPFFWAKIATFVATGLVSIGPTVLFLRWAKALRADAGYQPPAGEVAKAAACLRVQIGLLVPLVCFAAAMARWPF